MSLKPKYLHKPIPTLECLALKLGTTKEELLCLAENSDSFYRQNKPEVKPDGRLRIHYSVHKRLKKIQTRIKSSIFYSVEFPYYIQGSVKSSPETPRGYNFDAQFHAGSKLLISEDVTDFFPSIDIRRVESIWRLFFRFPDDVATVLAKLTTYNGALVQGSSTSSYLANLLFWDREHRIVKEVQDLGYTYSRYVDDISISTKNTSVSSQEKSFIISRVIGMLNSCGVKINRKKHSIATSDKPMTVHNLVVNSPAPTVGRKKKNQLRIELFNLQKFAERTNRSGAEYKKNYNSVLGKLGALKSFHPTLAKKLISQAVDFKPEK